MLLALTAPALAADQDKKEPDAGTGKGTAVGAVAAVTALKTQTRLPMYVVIVIDRFVYVAAFIWAIFAIEPNAMLTTDGRFIIRNTKPVALDGELPLIRCTVITFDDEERPAPQRLIRTERFRSPSRPTSQGSIVG